MIVFCLMWSWLALFITLSIGALPGMASAADTEFENNQIKIRIKARTPQQMAAFYEARGFPPSMIEKINQACFFTIGIKNKSNEILWHDLSGWKFTSDGDSINRFDRIYWKQLWQTMDVPLASQSTFRWTLMPEQLDFRPQEHEGGNITLPRGPLSYRIEATFYIGARQTNKFKVSLTDIRCANDTNGEKP